MAANEIQPRSGDDGNYSIEIVTYISSIMTEARYAAPEKREEFAQQLESAAETIRLLPNRKMSIGEVNDFFRDPRAFGKAASHLPNEDDK